MAGLLLYPEATSGRGGLAFEWGCGRKKTNVRVKCSKNKKKRKKTQVTRYLRTLSKAMGDQQPESRADGPADVGEGEGMGQSQQPDIAMGLMCLFQPVVEQIDLSVQGENKCL